MLIIGILEFIIFGALATWLFRTKEELAKKLYKTETFIRELTIENDKKRLAIEEQTENYAKLSQKYEELYSVLTEERIITETLKDKLSEKEKAEYNYKNLLDKKDSEIENLRNKYISELKTQEIAVKEKTELQLERVHQETIRKLQQQYLHLEKKYQETKKSNENRIQKLKHTIDKLTDRLSKLETEYKETQDKLSEKDKHIETLKEQLRKTTNQIQKLGRGAIEQAFLYNEALPNSMRRLPLFDVGSQTAIRTTSDTEVIVDESLLIEIKNCLCDLVDLL